MLKLLLISVSLIFVSCDNDSPTEVSPTEVSGLIDNVCGYDDFEYLAGCGSNQNGCGGLYLAEDIANTYCELEGYTSAISYDVSSSGTYINTLSWSVNVSQPICQQIGYHNIANPGWFGATESWPVISNLVCE